MNKTLALIAALGLVSITPAFAADETAAPAADATVKADAAPATTTEKSDVTTTATKHHKKLAKDVSKDKDAAKDNSMAPSAGEKATGTDATKEQPADSSKY